MANQSNKVIAYFDLQSDKRGRAALQGKTLGQPDAVSLTVIPQYVALVLGIVVQPYLEHFRTKGSWTFDWSSAWGWALFALIAGLIVFPSAYRKSFDSGQPKFVQFCVIFVAGIGWQALFLAAVKALPGS